MTYIARFTFSVSDPTRAAYNVFEPRQIQLVTLNTTCSVPYNLLLVAIEQLLCHESFIFEYLDPF